MLFHFVLFCLWNSLLIVLVKPRWEARSLCCVNNIQCGRLINRTFHIRRPKRTEALLKWLVSTSRLIGRSELQIHLEMLPSQTVCFLSHEPKCWSFLQTHLLSPFCAAMRQEGRHARERRWFWHVCAESSPFYTPSITGDLFITQLNTHTTYSQVRSHLNTSLVIILACQRRLIATGNKFHWHKKTHWDTKTRTCKHITEIATVSVDVTLTESFKPSLKALV